MGAKIYVGGLPYSTTEQQLSDLFAAHGTVASARIITGQVYRTVPGIRLC